MRIMIVDDDSAILDILGGFIHEFLGHECCSVSSTADALANLDTFKPQIIFTDYNMPEINGVELIRIVKEKAPHISVIMLSAENRLTVAVEAMRQGADDFVNKPANVDELDAAIKRVTDKWDNVQTAEEVERIHIETVMARCKTVAEAAQKLGMNASTIWRKKKSKINRAA